MQFAGLFSDKPLSHAKSAAIALIYFLVILTGVLHHELWLDEAHHFLLALYSSSFRELLFNTRYEGHPILWDGLIFIITRFTCNPFYMQLLNVVLCCGAVWLFLRLAPFSTTFKVMFIFGYYFIYEYSIISRNYALACLCLFAVLSFYYRRKENRILFALVVSALANTHLLAMALSAALLMQTLCEYFFFDKPRNGKSVFMACGLMFLGIAFAVWQAAPPAGNFDFFYVHHAFPYAEQSWKVCATPFKSLFNLCDFTRYQCWNSNLFTDNWWKISRLFFPLPLIVAFALLARKPMALFFFILSVCGILLIEFFALSADARHYGFIYLCFIAALWMSRFEPDKHWLKKPGGTSNFVKFLYKLAEGLVWLMLVLQIISGGILYGKDFYQPFNEGREVSSYLRKRGFQNSFIMVSNQTLGPVISTYMHREVYHTEAEREATFCNWNILPWTINDSSLHARIDQQLAQHDSIILLLDNSLSPSPGENGRTTMLGNFDKAFVGNGNYWVYLVVRAKH